jgi:ATP-dependent helicase/DNAse subunit B
MKTGANKAAEKGNIIHKAMEALAHLKLCQQNGDKYFESEGLGKVSVDDFNLDEILIKSYEYYKNQSQQIWEEKDWTECQKWLKSALTLNNGAFDPRNQKIVEAEKQFDIVLEGKEFEYHYKLPSGKEIKGNLAIKGTMDLIVELDDNTIEIIDYKTGSTRKDWGTGIEKDFDKLRYDQQLLLYYYAVSKIFPDKEIIVTIFYIRAGGPYTIPMDHTSKEAAELLLKSKFNEIKQVLIPRRDISFKCKKFCYFGMNKYKGTNSTICDHIHNEILRKGIGQVTDEYTVKGFNVCNYSDGGGRKEKK